MTKLIVAFHNFADAPEDHCSVKFPCFLGRKPL